MNDNDTVSCKKLNQLKSIRAYSIIYRIKQYSDYSVWWSKGLLFILLPGKQNAVIKQ